MDKKTTGIIATVVAVLLCGCPGIGLCLSGVATLAGLGTWDANVPGVVTETGSIPAAAGIPFLCVGIVFILIPVVVGFLMLRDKPADVSPDVEEF